MEGQTTRNEEPTLTTLEKPDERFQDFLRSFVSDGEHKYRKRLGNAALSGSKSLVVDFEDLIAFDPDLARSVLDKPDEYLEYLDRSAWAQLKIEDPEYAEIIKRLRIRMRKLPEKHALRRIGSENIGRLLLIDGIIVRSTSVKPLLIKAAFQCRKCNAMSYVEQAGILMRGPGLCAHCFPPNTIIAGHYKSIEEYAEGESIVSGCGETTGIEKIFRREYEGPLFTIKASGLLPIQTTPEHPLLTVGRSYHYRKNRHGNFAFERAFGQPKWKEAKNLQAVGLKHGDYLAVPRIRGWIRKGAVSLEPFTSLHGKLVARGQGRPLDFPIDRKTAWLLGLYAAEGSGCSTGLRLCLGAHEKRLTRRVACLARQLGYSPALTRNGRNGVQLHIRSRLLGRAFAAWFGSHAHERRVPDFILYNSDSKLASAFLRGYWVGNGCRQPNQQYRASTTSKTLALQLQLLAARLGIFIRIAESRPPPFTEIEGRLVNQRTLYLLSYYSGRSKRGRPNVVRRDYILTPIKKVQVAQYRGPVYNFQTGHETYVAQNAVVHNCRSKIFEFMEKQSIFMNSQEIRIQERPEDLPPGQLPRAMDIKLSEDLVDIARPGDRVSITGIARAQQEFAGRKARLRTFELLLDANYVDVMGKEVEVVEITPEDERQIRELAKDPFIHRKLIASLAPSIYGYGDIKEAVLYLLFGGVPKRLPDGVMIRGETNVLLVGDPGCLVADERVVLGDGTIIKIGEFGHRHLEGINTQILTGQEGARRACATRFHVYRNQPVLEIVTETGKSIKGTYNHPLLSVRKVGRDLVREWKRLDEFRIGDKVAVVTGFPCTKTKYVPTEFDTRARRLGPRFRGRLPSKVTPGLGALLGYMLGNGWVQRYRIGFTVAEPEKDLLPYLVKTTRDLFGISPSIHVGTRRARSVPLHEVCLGSEDIAANLAFLREKRVPDLILRSGNEVLSAFLKYLYDAAGSVFENARGSRAISLKAKNIELLRDVQLLLLRFGIHSRIIANALLIRRGEDMIRFHEKIGFPSKKKQLRLRQLVLAAHSYKRLHAQRSERIVKIVRHKSEDVYDIEVPDGHRFVANGIISHNTAKSQLLQYVSRIAPRGLYTSGRGTTAAGLTAAVVREKSGGMVLEAGALVLADKGIACMTPDTEVYVGDRVVAVEQLWNEAGRCRILPNGQELKPLFCPVASYYGEERLDTKSYTRKIVRRKHEGKVLKISFKSGLSIKITPEHLVRSNRSSKRLWIRAGELRRGDIVKAPKKLFPPLVHFSVGDRTAYTLGFIYGDGYVTTDGVTIAQSRNNENILQNVRHLSPFPLSRYDTEDKVKSFGKYVLVERLSRLWTGNRELRELYHSTIGRTVDAILQLPDVELSAFFAGLFDSDGNLNFTGNSMTCVRLFPSSNEHHLAVFLHGLRRLGVRGSIRRSRRNPNVHTIQINGTSMSKFLQLVSTWSVKAKPAMDKPVKHKGPRLQLDEEQIANVEELEYSGYVYDLCVSDYHNFTASGIYIHNCIDEMDKMRPEDRVAIHEALEQHSYHPKTEILLASGRKVRIGEFVDTLFLQNSSKRVLGRDCEILPLKGQGISLLTTPDFRKLTTVEVDRVSRHVAPELFVEISYSNGRRIVVTPEHPVYVFRNGDIRIVPASDLRKNDCVPGPRKLEPTLEIESLAVPSVQHHNEKTITLPATISENLAAILGYLITEGYSHRGSAAEIGFANTDPSLFQEMDSAMAIAFQIKPLDYSKVNRTHRYISSRLYRYLSQNFPGLVNTARNKRLPEQLMNAPANVVRAFLRSAFRGDGSAEPNALSYCTSSEGLAEDYQDLLLRLGVFSRIFRGKSSYKTYVTGDSLRRFVELVVAEEDKRLRKIRALVAQSRVERGHDILPTDVCHRLIKTQHRLGIRNDGHFWRHLKQANGITNHVFEKRIEVIESRLHQLERRIPEARSIRQLRELLHWSQAETATGLGLLRGTIDYAEKGGYNDSRRESILKAFRKSAFEVVLQAKRDIEELRALSELRWLKISQVRTLPNSGPLQTRWVYDVTVEPTHNFVSHGVILHNTVSVAKGGIVATLNARAAVLAAANPSLGRYDPYRNITDNINLPVTLLSRFDLLFIMKDTPEPDSDSRMSEHILALHRLKAPPEEPPMLPEQLRKYIAYSKRIEPVLTEEAVNEIRLYYLKMRSLSASTESPVAITPRQLEALVRLAEARAKSFLRDKVEAEDAHAIIRLMTLSLQDVGIDTATGKVDIDVIMTGKPKSLRDKMQVILSTFVDLEKQLGIVEEPTLYQALSRKVDITDEEARRLVGQLVREGILYSPKPGHLKRAAA